MRIDIDQRSRGFTGVSAQFRIAVSFNDEIDPRIDGNTWQARAASKRGDLYISWVQIARNGLAWEVARVIEEAEAHRRATAHLRANNVFSTTDEPVG